MPNWCSNTVDVYGSKKDITRFKEFVEGKDTQFSFDSILPMPSALRGTSAPTTIVSQEAYEEWMESSYERKRQQELGTDYSIEMEGLEGRPLTQELSLKYLRQYGNDNWYDWAYDNWGTKWDLDEKEILASIEPTSLMYKFDTAWNPPYGIYRELVKRFPKLKMGWRYEEEGMELHGNLANEEVPNRESARDLNERIAKILTGMQGNEAQVNTYS